MVTVKRKAESLSFAEFLKKELVGTSYAPDQTDCDPEGTLFEIRKRFLGLPLGKPVARYEFDDVDTEYRIDIFDEEATQVIKTIAEKYERQHGISVTISFPIKTM